MDNTDDGILLNGVLLNNIRYADDTVIIADTVEGLQRLIEVCKTYNMRLKTNKIYNNKQTRY